MSLRARLKADPGLMQRAMRCESASDIALLLKVEGINNPAEKEEAYSLFELGVDMLETVTGGRCDPRRMGYSEGCGCIHYGGRGGRA